MNKNNSLKTIILSTCLIIVVLLLLIFIFMLINDPSKGIIGTTLEEKMTVTPNIEKIDDTIYVYEGNDTLYFDYINDELVYENIVNKESNKDYIIEKNGDEYFLVNKKSQKKSEPFYQFFEIIINNNVTHVILKFNENFAIYNVSQDKYISLSENIVDFYDIYDVYNNVVSDKYLIAVDSNDNFGVIDYTGKTIIDFKYTNLSIMGENFLVRNGDKVGIIDKNENVIIDFKYQMLFEFGENYLSILNGKYGIIDSKGKELLEHKYDYSVVKDNHVVLSLDGKAGFYTNKLIMEPTIELSEANKLSSYTFNGNIHLLSNDKTYVIDNNGKIIDTLDFKLFLIMYGNKLEEYSSKYLYSREINGNNIKFNIYDKNYKNYYTFSINPDVSLDGKVMNTSIYTSNDKQFDIRLNIFDEETMEEFANFIYSYDFDNKRELTADDLEKNKLENGITYTIDINNNLTVYNDDKVIGKYKDILYFIDNYYFIDVNGVVYKLNFKYE